VQWFENLSIRYKMWGGYAVVFVVMLSISLTAIRNFGSVRSNVATLVQQEQPAIVDAERLSSQLNQSIAQMGLYLLSREAQSQEPYLQSLAELDQLFSELQQQRALQSDEMQTQLQILQAQIAQLQGYQAQVLEYGSNNAARMPALSLLSNEINPLFRSALQSASIMLQSELMEEATEERRALLHELHNLRYALLSVMSNVRGFVAFRDDSSRAGMFDYLEQAQVNLQNLQAQAGLFTFEQEEGVLLLEEQLQQVSGLIAELERLHGSEKAYMDVFLIRSEIGPLTAEAQTALARVGNYVNTRVSQVSNDLDEEMKYGFWAIVVLLIIGIVIGLSIAWVSSAKIMGLLNTLIDQLTQTSDDLNQTATSITDTAQTVSTQSTQQAAALEQTSATMEEFAAQTRQTSSGAQQASQTIDQMSSQMYNAAQESAQTVGLSDQAQQAAEHGVTAIHRIAGAMREIRESSTRINEILDLINEITHQTKMLATNAAIEAARAGEHGKGFAIVAEEVGKLAENSKDAAKQISDLVKENVQSSEQGNQLAENGIQALQDILHKSQQVAGFVKSMSAEVSTQATSAAEMMKLLESIRTAAHEQSEGVNQITYTVNEMSNSTQVTANQAEVNVQASGRLQQQAQMLLHIVNEIRQQAGRRQLPVLAQTPPLPLTDHRSQLRQLT
jgi:methyl-accepting chemotaxis protein